MNLFRKTPSQAPAARSMGLRSFTQSGMLASAPGLFNTEPGGPELAKADEIIRMVAARRERLRKA